MPNEFFSNTELNLEQKRQLFELLSRFPDSMTVGDLKKSLSEAQQPKKAGSEIRQESSDIEKVYSDFVQQMANLDIKTGRNFPAMKKEIEKLWPGLMLREAEKGIVIEDSQGKALMTILQNANLDHPSRDYFQNEGGRGFNYPVRKVILPARLQRRQKPGKFGEEFECKQKGVLRCE
jgi:hypothetical protein